MFRIRIIFPNINHNLFHHISSIVTKILLALLKQIFYTIFTLLWSFMTDLDSAVFAVIDISWLLFGQESFNVTEP